jgi:mono/diheme cytochrome c family protein
MQNTSCEEKLGIVKSNFTFDNTLKPILENYCIGCHSRSNKANGIDFTNKSTVLEVVKSGKLLNAISHETGVAPMPFMSYRLCVAEIESVIQWIQNGMN